LVELGVALNDWQCKDTLEEEEYIFQEVYIGLDVKIDVLDVDTVLQIVKAVGMINLALLTVLLPLNFVLKDELGLGSVLFFIDFYQFEARVKEVLELRFNLLFGAHDHLIFGVVILLQDVEKV
jgi:hypothetical protein